MFLFVCFVKFLIFYLSLLQSCVLSTYILINESGDDDINILSMSGGAGWTRNFGWVFRWIRGFVSDKNIN